MTETSLKVSLKTCIVHNADANRCGCPLEVSQADIYRYENETQEIPLIVQMGGLPEGMTPDTQGPFLMVWETTRSSKYGGSLHTQLLEFKKASN